MVAMTHQFVTSSRLFLHFVVYRDELVTRRDEVQRTVTAEIYKRKRAAVERYILYYTTLYVVQASAGLDCR